MAEMKWKWLILALLFMFLSTSLDYFSTTYIREHLYPNSVPNNIVAQNDLFFVFFQYKDWSIFTEAILIAGVLVFATYIIVNKKYNKLPYFFGLIGLFQLLRAFIIPLTPLPPPNLNYDCFGLLYKYQPEGGCFPSGHIGFGFLLFMFTMFEPKNKVFKWTLGLIVVAAIVAMLVSRGHYSIDIIGAIFIVYSLIKLTEKWYDKL